MWYWSLLASFLSVFCLCLTPPRSPWLPTHSLSVILFALVSVLLLQGIHVFTYSLVRVAFRTHPFTQMAKSKNHTNHNQTYKAHRNGIKKPKTYRHTSLRGVTCFFIASCFLFSIQVDQKFLRNQRFAKKANREAVKKQRKAARKAKASAAK